MWFRVTLAVGSVGVVGWRLFSLGWSLGAVASTTSTEGIPYNEAVQKGVELLVQQSDSWARATAFLIAVLAGLWIAKGDRPHLVLQWKLWPEIVMWFAGLFMLCAGLYCYNQYLDHIANALEACGRTSAGATTPKTIANVFHTNYEALRAEQFWFLVCGTSASCLAVFSLKNQSGGGNGRA
ncbi:MAG: hypothetical protein ABFD89_04210 [Bryobacteraceae bacterium]